MTFYQAMQLGAVNLKPLIKETNDKKLKQKYITAFVLKNILCLLFCILIITAFSSIFGKENNIVGVVTAISLLTFRFSNLDFDVKQSVVAILGIFAIFMVGPYLASISTPVVRFFINFISIMAIVILSCHNVVLSNQLILVLSYLLLYGYKVSSVNVYVYRVLALAVGAIIVAIIFYRNQRKIKFENKFIDIIKDVNLSNDRTKWQLKLTLAVCSALLIGDLLNFKRIIWIGFACNSVIHPYKDRIASRCKDRVSFTIVGCIIYSMIYIVLPKEYITFVGMIGGIMVGFSATYKWQTVFNAFGGLTSAVAILGIKSALIFRVIDNVFGAIYGIVFSKIFDKIEERITNKIKKI